MIGTNFHFRRSSSSSYGNDTVTVVTMNKISHLFAFLFYCLSLSFYSKMFLQLPTMIWTPITVYKLVRTDSEHIFYRTLLDACSLTFEYLKTLEYAYFIFPRWSVYLYQPLKMRMKLLRAGTRKR